MKNLCCFLISSLFLFTNANNLFSQTDYELISTYSDSSAISHNKTIESLTVYQIEEGSEPKIIKIIYFNKNGLPDSIYKLNKNDFLEKYKIFNWDLDSGIIKVESFNNGILSYKTTFSLHNNLIASYKEQVVSGSLYNDILSCYYKRNNNEQLIKKVTLQGPFKDSTEIIEYDLMGYPIITNINQKGIKTKYKIYEWDKNYSSMVEISFGENNLVIDSILHFYINGKEILRDDKSTSIFPYYWIYNPEGFLIETNQDLFYIKHLSYNSKMILTYEIYEPNPLSDIEKVYGSKAKIMFYYEYNYR